MTTTFLKCAARRSLGAAAVVAALWATQGLAQSTTTPFGGFQHDSTQPVEVAADTLEVRNEEQRAIFRGNVNVKQGRVRMEAQELTVTYAAGRRQDGDGAISRLQATGRVLITSGAETAEADNADYDVASGEILLAGNVLLLQGDNLLKGERLRIDLNTGTGQIEGGPGGRVKGTFDPSQSRNAN